MALIAKLVEFSLSTTEISSEEPEASDVSAAPRPCDPGYGLGIQARIYIYIWALTLEINYNKKGLAREKLLERGSRMTRHSCVLDRMARTRPRPPLDPIQDHTVRRKSNPVRRKLQFLDNPRLHTCTQTHCVITQRLT